MDALVLFVNVSLIFPVPEVDVGEIPKTVGRDHVIVTAPGVVGLAGV